jgi:gliding motility-associated-like protein
VVVLPRIYVPTAFTPNFDLTNDRFKVVTVGITSLEITIFDRWGMEVYRGAGIDFEWDGTKNGAELPPGAYPYVIFYTDFTNLGRRMQSGVVRLIK